MTIDKWVRKKYEYKALATRVLVVASINLECNEWAVYIDAVPGQSHKAEFMEVARHGDKLDKRLAEILFPHLADKHYWRD